MKAGLESLSAQTRQALVRGDADDLLRLLDEGADPNAPDGFGTTLLAQAVAGNRVEMACLLLAAGADAGAANNAGRTPLMIAASLGYHEMLQLLLERRPHLDAIEHVSGRTALHLAALSLRVEVARTLLDAGANPLLEDDGGFTPAALASREATDEMRRVLEAAERLWRGDLLAACRNGAGAEKPLRRAKTASFQK